MKVKELLEMNNATNRTVRIYDNKTRRWTIFRFKERNDERFAQIQDRVIQPNSIVLRVDWEMEEYLNLIVE